MHIIEIYKSLQGESSFAGLPCVFVRLAGCNLRCAWCDSEYTFTGGQKMSDLEILAEVQRLSPSGGLVEITGGEPMLQARELVPFLYQLLALELPTAAGNQRRASARTRPTRGPQDCRCEVSRQRRAPALPPENLATLTSRDELKFVLASREDYEYARDFIRQHGSGVQQRRIHAFQTGLILSPAFRKDASGSRSAENCLLDPRDLADWMLADNLQARLGLQIHKFIWEPQLKGV